MRVSLLGGHGHHAEELQRRKEYRGHPPHCERHQLTERLEQTQRRRFFNEISCLVSRSPSLGPDPAQAITDLCTNS